MASNRTQIENLNPESVNEGELTESEAANISGGQSTPPPESQRLTIIDTIYSNGTTTADFK